MPVMQPVSLFRKSVAVFDVRDWYRSTFVSPMVPDLSIPSDLPQMRPSSVRATARLHFFAEPISGNESAWPFPGRSELVVQRSSSGIYAFHGRVMLGGNVLAHATRRLPIHAECKLRLEAEGYQPHVIEQFKFDSSHSSPPNQRKLEPTQVEMFPGQAYPFPSQLVPPTLVQGVVRDENGVGIPNALVRIDDPLPDGPNILHTSSIRTDGVGKFLLVLDYFDLEDTETPIQTLLSPLHLTVQVGHVSKLVQADFFPNARKEINPELLVIHRT